jgi:hypothetical protein
VDGRRYNGKVTLIVRLASVTLRSHVHKVVCFSKTLAEQSLIAAPNVKPRKPCVALEEDEVPVKSHTV